LALNTRKLRVTSPAKSTLPPVAATLPIIGWLG
jgi:hypothetical protein